jgi:hypothetical protein
MSAPELDPMTLAEKLTAFLDGDAGPVYLNALNTEYRQLHHKSEDTSLPPYQKAYLVERAAGIKWCIDWLMTRKRNLEDGRYSKT